MYLETEPIPYGPGKSFASIRFEGPRVICPYHRHPEVELVSLEESGGRMVAGDFVGSFRPGDIFLLGSQLPHIFQSSPGRANPLVRTHVIQFCEDFCGDGFFKMPEFRRVQQLVRRARRGLKLPANARGRMRDFMLEIHADEGPSRVLRLLRLLVVLSETRGLEPLAGLVHDPDEVRSDDRMTRITAYIHENLSGELNVPEAARCAGLTPNAFCRYFRQQTRRTFTDVVNELRIGEACRLLSETSLGVTEVAFAAGYSNLAHFHAEFRRRIRKSPRTYRHTGAFWS